MLFLTVCHICVSPRHFTDCAVVKSYMLQALETGVQHGSLRLSDYDGLVIHFGDTSNKKDAADIHILNDDFWLRLYLSYDVGCKSSKLIIRWVSMLMSGRSLGGVHAR
jgi:hypothetical protein